MAEILVIDDEAPIRETLKEILEYENYTVTTADDGNKGLQLIQKNDYDVFRAWQCGNGHRCYQKRRL